jgi:hypothetical protein
MGKYHIISYVIGVIHSTPLRDTTHPDARLNLPIADARKEAYPILDFHDVYYPTWSDRVVLSKVQVPTSLEV